MAMALAGLSSSSTSSNLNFLYGEDYDLKLTQSLCSILSEIPDDTAKLSHLVQQFYEFVQARVDPPLESIWVYVALKFRSHNFPKDNLLDRIAAAKDLFQLISGCSVSCGSSKSIALLAPVVYEVNKVVVEFLGKDLSHLRSKAERKLKKEVKCLVESIIGYISVCCGKDLNKEAELGGLNFLTPFGDLIRLWIDSDEAFESFLPLVTGEIHQMFSEESCDVSYLAGVVIMEVFLLQLCFDFRSMDSGKDVEAELKTWTVASITMFSNFYFFEILVKVLLEKTLPVTSLLRLEDEPLLRKVMYDAVILVEYSFLNPERTAHLPSERLRSLSLARLIVSYEAVEFFRKQGDQRRSISYISAFSNSHLLRQIIKWMKSQFGVDESLSKFNGSCPKALLKCLLTLEDQGVRVFDDSLLQYHDKLVHDISKTQLEKPGSDFESQKADDDILFYIDKKGENTEGKEIDNDEGSKMNESMSAAFIAAASAMESTEKGGRKRMGKSDEKKAKIKFLKYDILRNSKSSRGRTVHDSNSIGSPISGSEVENPQSEEEEDDDLKG